MNIFKRGCLACHKSVPVVNSIIAFNCFQFGKFFLPKTDSNLLFKIGPDIFLRKISLKFGSFKHTFPPKASV